MSAVPVELPPRCQSLCPLNKFEDIGSYPVSLLHNCPGPNAGTGDITEKNFLSKDGKIRVEDPDGTSSVGRLVCRNMGLIRSLEALKESQGQGTAATPEDALGLKPGEYLPD